ncbi:DUF4397 domain-containing protein [Chitinilyticum litopenaei]|uniref:DUF4397 domain-containing protein n=1 Tax=Chitinilyticum litopenaei TaxID=1121276 RepID=UPI0003F5FFA2|nr:DUF4397 domain-containing protein [Chitinilyticum litopenaei]
MNTLMTRLLRGLLVAAGALALAACGGGSGDEPAKPESKAYVRVVHASADAPNVDVYANDARVLSNVPYKAASGLLAVPTGTLPLKVTVAGTMTEVPSFTNALPMLENGKVYTVFAINPLASIKPLLLVEDLSTPEAGKLKVRVAHVAAATGNVDVYVSAPGADLATTAPTLANVPYAAVSDVLQIPGGDYRIRITVAGSKAVAFDSGTVPLAAGSDLVVAAVDQKAGTSPVSLLVLSRDAAAPVAEVKDSRAAVRAIHASPDAPAVDVVASGSVLFPNVSFFAASAYANVPAASYDVALNLAGTATSALSQNLAVAAGKHYSVFAVGLAAGTPALQYLVAEDDRMAPASGKAKVRVVHASPDAPAVDVAANGSNVLTNVAFPAVSAYLEVPAGAYTFDVKPAGSASVVKSATVTLEAGKIYTVVARGLLAGSNAQAFTLSVLNDN